MSLTDGPERGTKRPWLQLYSLYYQMNTALTATHFPSNPLNYPADPEMGPDRCDSSRGGGLTAVVADVAQGSTRLKQHLLVLAVEQLNQWGDEACLHTGTPHELCHETNTAQVSHGKTLSVVRMR